jgi:hypothetical protein
MLTLIIREIFFAGVPLDIVCILCNFITNPKISHFYRTQSLPFDGIVHNTNSGGVVAMDGCFGLRGAQFFWGYTKNQTFLEV